ncbi:MAG: 16S rRNA (cytosine(1402)-N(4))-methyltransferase RsmH [Lachnospiraceae bacterium]|nr:16S rRNA (cytosine(1402)-N(4))-methyltransferase RsmH [Lachnospiraceae bacterium]
MGDNNFEHVPVLYKEVIEGLNIKPEGIYLDGTLGGAGHASGVLKSLHKGGMLIGIDQDREAIFAAGKKLQKTLEEMMSSRVKASELPKYEIYKSNYEAFESILAKAGAAKVDGILLDLGVSSHQLDAPERGFSYRYDAPLDMRMDLDQEKTAYDIINTYDEIALFKIIRDYGEDRFAKNIAKHICEARKVKPVETTFELNEIIRAAIPAKVRAAGGHPSKRTFQAVRIELNRELEVLEKTLDKMIERLSPQGRLCVITFHSLEDRIVKNIFNKAENPCVCPPEFPVCVCGRVSKGKVITKKPIIPDEDEVEDNIRAKSSKLRVFEKK